MPGTSNPTCKLQYWDLLGTLNIFSKVHTHSI